MVKATKMIADDLDKVGVKINLQVIERNTYLAKAKALDFDIYAGRWGVMDEPADYMGLLFFTNNWDKGSINYSGINDPKLDQLIQEAQSSMEKKAMVDKMYAIQEYLHDVEPVVTLWVETYNLAISDKWPVGKSTQRPPQLYRSSIARQDLSSEKVIRAPGGRAKRVPAVEEHASL